MFQRRPTEADFGLVAERSFHVSRLQFNPTEEKASLVFSALLRLFPAIDLFPHLKELSIVASPSQDSFPVPFTILPLVEYLIIQKSPEGDNNSVDMLDALVFMGPGNSLKTLELSSGIFPFSFERWTSSNAKQLEWQVYVRALLDHHKGSLHHLKLDQAPAAPLVRMIAELEALETLDVSDPRMPGPWYPPPEIPEILYSISFDQLQTINFHHARALRNTRVQCILFPKLENFTFTQTSVGRSEFNLLSEILEYAGFFPTLRYLHIECKGYPKKRLFGGSKQGARLPSELFAGLLECGNLKYLHVTWPRYAATFAPTNELARSMALAWPDMAHLYIDPAICTGSKVAFCNGVIYISYFFYTMLPFPLLMVVAECNFLPPL